MFVVNKNSWHYRWMMTYKSCLTGYSREHLESWSLHQPKDFCSYWRNVLLWPAIRISLNLVPYIALFGLMYIFGYSGFVGASAFLIGGLMLAAALISVYIVVYGITFSFRKTKNKMMSDDFIKMAYDSYKENYCPLVEYKDNADVK